MAENSESEKSVAEPTVQTTVGSATTPPESPSPNELTSERGESEEENPQGVLHKPSGVDNNEEVDEGTIEASLDDDCERPTIQEIDEGESTEKYEAWTFLRKGAVAAVGGTMVGVGLVMVRTQKKCCVFKSCYQRVNNLCVDSAPHTFWSGHCKFWASCTGNGIGWSCQNER